MLCEIDLALTLLGPVHGIMISTHVEPTTRMSDTSERLPWLLGINSVKEVN